MPTQPNKLVKAVGLLSGGLDSLLAAKIVKDLGVEVYAVYFAQPWGCCDKGSALAVADQIGIKFIPLQLDERYLEMIRFFLVLIKLLYDTKLKVQKFFIHQTCSCLL